MIGWFESWGIGSWYLRVYLLWGGALVGAAVLGWVFRRRMPRAARATLVTVLVLATVRLVVFDNPISLRLMQRLVTAGSIGGRQWGVLDLDILKYTRRIHQPELANLAVGSSQVGAIFSHWVGDPSEPLEVFSLAGMKTMDYELYREEIAARNPARVILYLSAFDLTAAPELYSWSLAPAHPSRIPEMIARVRSSGLPDDVVSGPSHEYIASQLLPEYRYRFLFGGFLQQLARSTAGKMALSWFSMPLHAAEVAQGGAGAAHGMVDDARIREFLGYHLPEWLDFNMGFLRSFVAFCRTRGIEVVIVEGQVSPQVSSSPKLVTLERMVRARFAELALLYPNVRVVETGETHPFAQGDYNDLTHVHPEAARRYTAHLSGLLGRAVVPQTGVCDLTFTQGWHPREGDGADWLRWSSGTGRLRLRAVQTGTYTLRTRVLSLARPNVVDVVVDGQSRAAWSITDPAWTFHPMPDVQVTLTAGETSIVQLVGQAPPDAQSRDARPLTIAISGLALVGPHGETCAINH